MSAKIEFFPVDNGDMTLITLESGRKILIDIHIRNDEDEGSDITEVAPLLRDRLDRDDENRPYIDAFLLTHPDKDHVLGLSEHFHTGPLADYDEDGDKIVIREMWSSPIIFRRKTILNEELCDDAKEWWAEARRRVQAFRDGNGAVDGNRILVLGEDIGTKSVGLDEIRIDRGEEITRINGEEDGTFVADLLGPLSAQHDEETEEALAKNRSSVILRFRIAADGTDDACLFLTGGDAEVLVWERLWQRNQDNLDVFSYDILQTPHHCSIHSLSSDSWSEIGERLTISQDARSALSQAREGAYIVASCKPISDEDQDPPCVRAEREYESILKPVNGEFLCTGDVDPKVLAFDIGSGGPGLEKAPSPGPVGPVSTRLDPPTREFRKDGGGRYA